MELTWTRRARGSLVPTTEREIVPRGVAVFREIYNCKVTDLRLGHNLGEHYNYKMTLVQLYFIYVTDGNWVMVDPTPLTCCPVVGR